MPLEAAEAEDEEGEAALAAHEALAAQRHACFDFDELDAKPREMFVDSEFPPTAASLHGAAGQDLECFRGLQWMRPEQLDPVPELFSGGSPRGSAPAGANNVLQGKLDDCYVIAAMSLLTLDGPLLRRLFASYLPEEGRCVVRLFLYGEWKEVEVDTLLPCDRGEPAFAHARDGLEVFACFLEKALAKVYGSFHALTGGNMGEALHDLTGTAVDDINLARMRPDTLSYEVWELLTEHRTAKNLIACGRSTAGGEAAAIAAAQGLHADHAYSVMALAEPQSTGKSEAPRLLRVVNPWGQLSWRGAWSGTSEEWTEALREELQVDGSDTGAFWIEISDFLRFFNRLHICRSGLLRERDCARASFGVETSLATAGGCSNFPSSFHRNLAFRVARPAKAAGPLEVFATVSHPDARKDIRSTPGARMTYPQMGITLLAQDFQPGVATDAQCLSPNRYEVIRKTSFWNKRDVSMVFDASRLRPGREYRVVPSCFFPDDPAMGRFVLHFYWRGSQDDLVVERVEDAARTLVTVSGSLPAAHGPSAFGQQQCYRVTGPDSTIPISVVIVKAPKLSRQWYLGDPLHAALHALFEAFDANGNAVLEREEMHALLDALAESRPRAKASLGQDAKDAIFREFDRVGSGAVTLGQLVAQSSSLLAALRVPKAELRGCVEGLARSLGREGQLVTASAASRHLAAAAAARGVYISAAPLRCHPEEYEGPEASLALGCGDRLPVLSNAAVWSGSFQVRQAEFFLCPFSKEGSSPCDYEMKVLSPLAGVAVEPCGPRPPASGMSVAF